MWDVFCQTKTRLLQKKKTQRTDEWKSNSFSSNCLGSESVLSMFSTSGQACKTRSYPFLQPHTRTCTHTQHAITLTIQAAGVRRRDRLLSLISSHPGPFVSTWSLPVISQLLCKLFNRAHVWKRLNTPDTTPGKALSCRRATGWHALAKKKKGEKKNRTPGVNEWISKAAGK